jgi:hypothetical protein
MYISLNVDDFINKIRTEYLEAELERRYSLRNEKEKKKIINRNIAEGEKKHIILNVLELNFAATEGQIIEKILEILNK